MDEFPELPGYVIERELSRTLMSVVYLARQPALNNRLVAIKVLAPKHAGNPDFRARFRREVDASAALTHPNIVPVLDAPAGQELLYLVMPYIDGWSLADELARGPLEPARTAHIVREVAAALDHAHRHGVVHRDVKPGNIMLHRHRDHAYLLDFGISAQLEGERLTQAGHDVGTPRYLAPELSSGFEVATGTTAKEPVTRQADVFSLGVVAYRCLTGRLPHDHLDTGGALWEQLAGTPPTPAGTLRPGLPAAVDHVLATALARPEHRYGTCGEFADALAAALAPAPDPPTLPATAPPRRPSRLGAYRAPLLVGAVAIALIVAFVAIWVPLGDDGSGPDLLRVPAALVGDCADDAGLPGAEYGLLCRDGEQVVRYSMFADRAEVDDAYAAALAESGIPRGSGDCTRSAGAEHRYPGAGPQTGRVVCYSSAGTTTLVWTDDERRTVARAEARASGDTALTEAWARWVGIPAFPTEAEQALIDLVRKPDCRRAEAGTLDSFRDLTAAIECDANSRLATAVGYYRFADLDALRRTYDGHVREVNPPAGPPCYDNPPGFLGDRRYHLRSVDVGEMLCYPGERGTPTLEWTVEPLLTLARATGPDPAELAEWWNRTLGIPPERVVAAVNERAEPPFPTAEERALLAHVPPASRTLCLRPSPEQVRDDAGDAATAAVACGPTAGAGAVYYYQFADVAAMNASYAGDLDVSGPDCTTVPRGFTGDAPYARAGATGRLGCEQRDGRPFLSWTHERLRIAVFAYRGASPELLLEWWRTEAGPV
ncbi:MAG TPA: serine/threonine-protein kinase [Actinophytocola sp.]|nr:serine/threonine-protein kinase [Actinophytocola sp.]